MFFYIVSMCLGKIINWVIQVFLYTLVWSAIHIKCKMLIWLRDLRYNSIFNVMYSYTNLYYKDSFLYKFLLVIKYD